MSIVFCHSAAPKSLDNKEYQGSLPLFGTFENRSFLLLFGGQWRTTEDKIEFETEEPEISVPADNTIEYDEPQIEIPDTGSNPFWAVAVCIIGIGAVFALALI